MTAIQPAPLPAALLPSRNDRQGVGDAIELFILERRADKKQPSTIRYSRAEGALCWAWLDLTFRRVGRRQFRRVTPPRS